MIVEQRFEAVRPEAVRPPGELHLQHAEIDTHLELLAAVLAGHDPDLDRVGFEIPAAEYRGQIFAHGHPVHSSRESTGSIKDSVRTDACPDKRDAARPAPVATRSGPGGVGAPSQRKRLKGYTRRVLRSAAAWSGWHAHVFVGMSAGLGLTDMPTKTWACHPDAPDSPAQDLLVHPFKARCRRGSWARAPWYCARRPGRWCVPRPRRDWRLSPE